MLNNKIIVLGVTGGIAVYKGAELASKLNRAGAKVRVIMTRAAQEFVTPLTFKSLTDNVVITDIYQTTSEHRVSHVALSEMADIILIAPATANTIAKIANGLADDMLTATVLATRAPVIIVPSMHTSMWENAVTQENTARLKQRGFYIIEPAIGHLASGGYGPGRFPDTEVIIGHTLKVLGKNGDLAGRHIVVTAGGTQEPIDPVRIIGNRSSGKMGYALAEAARDRGAEVTLITAPAIIDKPVGIEIIPVETAGQMQEAVELAVKTSDALIMAAAVADYQVAEVARNKIKKENRNLILELVRTPDILSGVNGNFLKIGFAAESQNLIAYALAKIEKKRLDLIVANDISDENSGFGTDTNRVTLIGKDGEPDNLPVLSKREVADRILNRILKLFPNKTGRI